MQRMFKCSKVMLVHFSYSLKVSTAGSFPSSNIVVQKSKL